MILEDASLEQLLHVRHMLADHISHNEELEEVKTQDLPYIATDYYIALKYAASHADRVSMLQLARKHLESFFEWLELFKLGSRPSVQTPVARQAKIDRLLTIRELESELPADVPREEESQRDYWVRWLRLRGLVAANEYTMGLAELSLLDSGSQGTTGPPNRTSNVQVGRPFTLTRDRARGQVFRPGHNLPTMTIDDFLELEVERGNILSGTGTADARGGDPERDSEFDAETAKMRARDDRWDWIRKGSGNTYNRS